MQPYLNYIEYTNWANNKIINWLTNITGEQWLQHIPSSFNSIKDTTQHIISAEYIWWQRLTGQQPVWLQTDMSASKEEAISQWLKTLTAWQDYKVTLPSLNTDKVITITRLDGTVQQLSIAQIIMHVCNHSTQHRGQLVTQLRQAGFTQISSIDLVSFFQHNF